jgi:hypothetical protein
MGGCQQTGCVYINKAGGEGGRERARQREMNAGKR